MVVDSENLYGKLLKIASSGTNHHLGLNQSPFKI